MAAQLKQVLRQSQTTVMTQKLQEAIKLLQLSSTDLAAVIENEVEKNPFLELQENETEGIPAVDKKKQDGDRRATSVPDRKFDSIFDLTGSTARGISSSLPRSSWSTSSNQGGGAGENSLEERVAMGVTLRDHLLDQLVLSFRDPDHQRIGRELIDALDETGYLQDSTGEIAARADCTLEDAEKILTMVQAFDPPGVFARSLPECLAIQLRDSDRFDPAMQVLIDNLDALADGRRDWLRQKCNVGAEDFADMLGELRTLDPRPGLVFDDSPTETIIPDVIVRRDAKGDWVLELNPDVLPRVLVDKSYYTDIRGKARTKEEKAYLSERMGTANWLLKSLEQRSQTILSVAREIVRQQLVFFSGGIGDLCPLTLRQIAEEINCHESTVSRVTANKYMLSPHGILPLKYFFSASIPSIDGLHAYAAEAVRHEVKTLIYNEKPDAILSDEKIVKILKQEGIDIARRTVTKYREGMRIPSSVQRRRIKTVVKSERLARSA